MDFADWMLNAQGRNAAILIGGTVEAFDKIATFNFGCKTRILCAPSDLSRLSGEAELAFLAHVKATVVQNMRNYISTLSTSDSAVPTFATSGLMSSFIESEVRFCRRHADVLSGYSTPQPILERTSRAALRGVVRKLLRRGDQRLVIHDPHGKFGFAAEPGITLFNIDNIDDRSNERELQDDPTLAQVLLHANFICSTDMPSLVSMHGPLMRTGYRPLFDYWVHQIKSCGSDETHADIVEEALSKFSQLMTALDD